MWPNIQSQHFVLDKFDTKVLCSEFNCYFVPQHALWLAVQWSSCICPSTLLSFYCCADFKFSGHLFFYFLFTFPLHAESEVCKLETLLQSEVSVVTTGEAVGADAAKTPPALRRRKRTCSRRQGEKEREREGGGMGTGDRGDRGVGEERDRREASKSDRMQMLKCFGSELELQSLPPTLKVMSSRKSLNPSSVQYYPLVVLLGVILQK